ncbi:hypothetical protein WR25_04627 isoform B [Diploscapter pachys]|nr:hypothetical protein WR25_04627 isoform B [Diploscapter pachys]
MYVIVIVCLILSLAHLITSLSCLYGAVKYRKMYIWPWFFTCAPLICMTTAYAVLWWSGDIFNEQLTFSVAEFVMSCCINGVCLIIVLFFYCRLAGNFTSNVPRHSHKHRRKRKRRHTEQLFIMPSPVPIAEPSVAVPVQQPYTYYAVHGVPAPAPLLVQVEDRYSEKPPNHLPAWRTEWPDVPDAQLQRKLKRHMRKEMGPKVEPARIDGSLDFYAPEPYDGTFPWKMKRIQDNYRRQRESPAEKIAKMYYEHWPEELPNIPKSMRQNLRTERERTEDQMRHEGLQKTTNIIS